MVSLWRKKEGTLVDIKDSEEEDRQILKGILERIAQHEADLAIERERKDALDKYHAVLKGEFGRLSNGRPHHLTLSSLLPFRLRHMTVVGWIAERVRVDIAVPARLSLIALSIERKHVHATIKYLEFAIKDETQRSKWYEKLTNREPASPPP